MKKKYNVIIVALLVILIIFYVQPAKADEQACLAEAIYFEARSETFIAQLAVANVILERVRDNRYPGTICQVVHQGRYRGGKPVRHRCMFSYWCDGKPETIANIGAYKTAVSIAELSMEGVILDNTDGSTHYHATYVRPYWTLTEDFERVGQVGGHIFYVDIGDRGVYNSGNK
jgi:spore germination cell wall hydrolase CwlJ-like protein